MYTRDGLPYLPIIDRGPVANRSARKEAPLMEGVGLTLLGFTFVERLGKLLHRRHRTQSLPIVARNVRCPLHDCQAEVAVRTDPRARARQQYVDVVGCSLLSDAAIGLPEQRAYLPDGPPCEILLETARRYPVYATGVSCRQQCRFVLNVAASPVAAPVLACASGASDAIELMRQADPSFTDSRLLWYSGA